MGKLQESSGAHQQVQAEDAFMQRNIAPNF
jgi:hypothetical protein